MERLAYVLVPLILDFGILPCLPLRPFTLARVGFAARLS
jgi:hypothetical protein